MKWRTIQPKISLKIFLSLKLTLYLAVVCIASNSSAWANQCPRYWPGLKEVEKQSLHGFHVWDHILFCLQDNYQVINWLRKEGIPRHPCLQGLCSSLCINSANTCMFAESVSDNLENQMTVSRGNPQLRTCYRAGAQLNICGHQHLALSDLMMPVFEKNQAMCVAGWFFVFRVGTTCLTPLAFTLMNKPCFWSPKWMKDGTEGYKHLTSRYNACSPPLCDSESLTCTPCVRFPSLVGLTGLTENL